jgi:exopolysaccharide biosynthesis polyprenyl glycosylphosphotransferase
LALKFNGVEIEEGVEFFERHTGRIYVREIKPSDFIFADGFRHKRGARRAKRLFDVAVALLGLVLAAPIMLATAIVIRLESRGPVLYRQIRSGELGREFSILKFRSMRVDAEHDGARWASVDDARVTKVGSVLRKMRIDELPQLWNVLRGDMSLVGPRPERPVFVRDLERQVPFFRQRLYVKPGVTGHAQVRCRYASSVEDSLEKLQYDLYYIKSFSLLFDLSILVDTLKVVLLKVGAR